MQCKVNYYYFSQKLLDTNAMHYYRTRQTLQHNLCVHAQMVCRVHAQLYMHARGGMSCVLPLSFHSGHVFAGKIPWIKAGSERMGVLQWKRTNCQKWIFLTSTHHMVCKFYYFILNSKGVSKNVLFRKQVLIFKYIFLGFSSFKVYDIKCIYLICYLLFYYR